MLQRPENKELSGEPPRFGKHKPATTAILWFKSHGSRPTYEFKCGQQMVLVTPFDIDDATLIAEAGACTNCPKRTSNNRMLFSDVTQGDLCSDPGCFGRETRTRRGRVDRGARGQGERGSSASAGSSTTAPQPCQRTLSPPRSTTASPTARLATIGCRLRRVRSQRYYTLSLKASENMQAFAPQQSDLPR